MSYQLAKNLELIEKTGEHFLVSKSPLCVLRLNRALAELLRSGQDGSPIRATEAEVAVMEQLATKGFVERVRMVSQSPATLPTVSIVIPVKDRADELKRCLESIARIDYPKGNLQLIVVDDGSRDNSAEVARQNNALVVESGGTGRGPAAARNVGARAATGDILAFIDSDCTASKGWLTELVTAFNAPAMAAVGGQVDGMCTESAVDRYEAVMSSLSLGARERIGNKGDDTFYLPSCNLLVRRTVFLNVGGFKDEMHVGEDVDLTWRLRDSGWTIAYLPAGSILHEHRSSIRSFMSRRFDYGTSEGMLQRLHPQRHKRMIIPPLLALLLTLCLMAPLTGGWSLVPVFVVMAVDVVAMRRRMFKSKLPVGPIALLCGRLRALGSLIYYLSFHLVRYYSLAFIAGALIFPLLWLPFLGAIACAAGVDYAIRKPDQLFIGFTGIYLLEHIAYGAGVFWGCLRRRTFASYRVEILRQMEAV